MDKRNMAKKASQINTCEKKQEADSSAMENQHWSVIRTFWIFKNNLFSPVIIKWLLICKQQQKITNSFDNWLIVWIFPW